MSGDGEFDDDFDRAVTLQNMLLGFATGGAIDEYLYLSLRSHFLEQPDKRPLVPKFIRRCRDGDQLWQHFKSVWTGGGAYQARRDHIYEEFQPLLDRLEQAAVIPADAGITETLSSFDPGGVYADWQRALERRHQDPEGAITASRRLLESVCKHILEEAGQTYGNDDLPKLYAKTAELMNLAPSQHTEKAFKQILGGCHNVVETLGTLRNKLGDAHGQGPKRARPSERHAALAVNLAGSMAAFLVETWQNQHG